jgi:putative flavoprotein involved in K+ transport
MMEVHNKYQYLEQYDRKNQYGDYWRRPGRFGRAGVILTGKVAGVKDDRIYFADDLADNLNLADKISAQICNMLDERIQAEKINAPLPSEEELMSDIWEPARAPTELSMSEAGINAVIWAAGYNFDFSWIKGLTVDAFGYPVQQQGVTHQPGIIFVGLHWLSKFKSGLLYGVAEDAAHVATHLSKSMAERQVDV